MRPHHRSWRHRIPEASWTPWLPGSLTCSWPSALLFRGLLIGISRGGCEEDAVRGEVPVNPPLLETLTPLEPPFFGFLTLGFGWLRIGSRLLGAFPSAAPPPPPPPADPPPLLRRHAFHLDPSMWVWAPWKQLWARLCSRLSLWSLFSWMTKMKMRKGHGYFCWFRPAQRPLWVDFALRVFSWPLSMLLSHFVRFGHLASLFTRLLQKKYCVNNLKYNLYPRNKQEFVSHPRNDCRKLQIVMNCIKHCTRSTALYHNIK